MSVAFQEVPWYDIQEWQEVYDKIYAQTSSIATKQKALDHLLIWKARCPSLPASIESTLNLLEVHVQDLKSNNDVYSDNLIRLAYSSSLMRFINHMLDKDTAKGLTLYQAAKNSGIPDWIIELRHDTAHSEKLPLLETLREATLICLEWLQNNYWDKHKQCIGNLIIGKLQDGGDIEDKIAALINFCISLSICSHSKCEIKYVSQITDDTLRESLVNDAKELFEKHIDFTNLKSVSINSLTEVMISRSKKILDNDLAAKYVYKVLLSDECLFLSLELHTLLDCFNLDCSKPFNKKYIECFEGLLNFLHINDLLQDFTMELIKITQSNLYTDNKCKLVSQWVSVILKALKINQLFMEKIYETEAKMLSMNDKKDIYTLFYHWFPNKKESLILDLRKPVPKDFSNITFIQPIITAYNPYLTYFIKDLLYLIQPCLPKSVIDKICKLAKIVASPEKFPVESLKIYTVDDLKAADVSNLTIDIDKDEILEDTSTTKEVDSKAEECYEKFGIWEKSSNNHAWSTCPIGQLPWQSTQPTESMEI